MTDLKQIGAEGGYYDTRNSSNLENQAHGYGMTKAVASQPDCRLCHYYAGLEGCFTGLDCTNGDKYQEATKVVLWRTE